MDHRHKPKHHEPKKPASPRRKKLSRTLAKWSLIFIGIIMVLTVILRLFTPVNTVTDKTHGFRFTNTKGWDKILPKDGAYMSFATLNGNTIISYADIRPVKKQDQKNITESEAKKNCDAVTKNSIAVNKTFGKTTVNEQPAYKCMFEAAAQNTEATLQVEQYTVLSPKDKQHDFILSFSYPMSKYEETEKVLQLIKSFEVK